MGRCLRLLVIQDGITITIREAVHLFNALNVLIALGCSREWIQSNPEDLNCLWSPLPECAGGSGLSLDLLSPVWFEQDKGGGPVVPLWSRLHIGESLVATNTGDSDQGHLSDVAEAFLMVRPKATAGKEISHCFSLFQ